MAANRFNTFGINFTNQIYLYKMIKNIAIIFLIFLSFSGMAQNKMRSLNQLVIIENSGWPFVQQLIDSAKNKIEVLAVDTSLAKTTLFETRLLPEPQWGPCFTTPEEFWWMMVG